MSRTEILIQELLAYYESTRGAGHTRTMLYGAMNNKNALVLVGNRQTGGMLARNYQVDHTITLDQILMGHSLRGIRAPLVIDNHAMIMILRDMLKLLGEQNSLLKKVEQDRDAWKVLAMTLWFYEQNQTNSVAITDAPKKPWNRIRVQIWSFAKRMMFSLRNSLKAKIRN